VTSFGTNPAHTMVREVLNQIHAHRRFVLTSHARPDGDGVGSVLACREIVRALGREAEVILHDPVPRNYRSLPLAGTILRADSVDDSFDAAVLLECDSLSRTRLAGLQGKFLINIDHHNSGQPFGHVNWIEPQAIAVAELVYRLAREAGVAITPPMATCLYTALVADTGSFMFEGTNEETFALAQELVRCGAEPARVARSLYFSHSTAKVRLLGAALSQLHREGDLAWIWVTQEQMDRCGAIEEDCEGLVNYALAIQGVEVAVFFRELPEGRFRVSLRSKGRVDVSRVTERLGGGGHRCASGCAVDGPLATAIAGIVDLFRPAPPVQ
jgi:phosphoesterase RecJ-like protein